MDESEQQFVDFVREVDFDDPHYDTLPKYCAKCRRKLQCTIKIYRYDDMTGRPLLNHILTCPKYRWIFPRHDKRDFYDGIEFDNYYM